MSPRHAERRLAAALLVAVFVSFEWPVLLHPLSSAWGVPGGDFGQTLWNFWVAAKEIGAGRSPWTTELLFAGRTTSLFYHTLNLFYFLAAAPVYLLTRSELAAFNVSHLAAGALGLACFYRLARALGARRTMAVLVAACFAYSPYYLRRLMTLNIQSIWLIALYALCLLRLWRRARRRDAVAVGLCVVAFLLASWHYLIFSAMATPFLVVWFAASQRGVPLLDKRRALLALLAFAVALPALALYAGLAVSHSTLAAESDFPNAVRIRCSASPLYYLVPGWIEQAWMGWIEPYRRPEVFAYRIGREHTLFLGVVAILLIARRLADPRSLRPHVPALVAALVFFVLSLGPALILFAPVTYGGDRMILLPGNWLHLLPVFSSIRHVTRFGVMVLFFLLLVAATPGGRPRKPLSLSLTRWPALAAVLVLLVVHVADMQPFGKRHQTWRPSADLRRALADPAIPSGAAMILPAFEWQSEGLGMYLQTMHHRTLVAGYLSRDPEAEITCTQTVRLFVEQIVGLNARRLGPADLTPIPRAALPPLVLLDRRRLGVSAGSIERVLEKQFHYRRTFRDPRLVVMVRGG